MVHMKGKLKVINFEKRFYEGLHNSKRWKIRLKTLIKDIACLF